MSCHRADLDCDRSCEWRKSMSNDGECIHGNKLERCGICAGAMEQTRPTELFKLTRRTDLTLDQKRIKALRILLLESRSILESLKYGCGENKCFCDASIGDPRISSHMRHCSKAMDFLESFPVELINRFPPDEFLP